MDAHDRRLTRTLIGVCVLGLLAAGCTTEPTRISSAHVQGQVTDHTGQPIDGAELSVGFPDAIWGPGGWGDTVSDSNGHYVLRALFDAAVFCGPPTLGLFVFVQGSSQLYLDPDPLECTEGLQLRNVSVPQL